MNSTFREYVFGRTFNLSLSKNHVDTLAALCQSDDPTRRTIASLGFSGSGIHGLSRRGLVEQYSDGADWRWRPTRAGVLVYDLMVEAGEFAAMEEQRRAVLDTEHKQHREEWLQRFGRLKITLRDRFQRLGAAVDEPAD